ncbi:MAG: hypothetical protein IKD61_01465, partial [Oscillospiraceae bacterium]|nr:hypothetical protein [Oscillospiraceae bacterium]
MFPKNLVGVEDYPAALPELEVSVEGDRRPEHQTLRLVRSLVDRIGPDPGHDLAGNSRVLLSGNRTQQGEDPAQARADLSARVRRVAEEHQIVEKQEVRDSVRRGVIGVDREKGTVFQRGFASDAALHPS